MWPSCLVCSGPLWACVHEQPGCVMPASSIDDTWSSVFTGIGSFKPAPVVDRAHYPHDCPSCGAPAWVGPVTTDCSRPGCR